MKRLQNGRRLLLTALAVIAMVLVYCTNALAASPFSTDLQASKAYLSFYSYYGLPDSFKYINSMEALITELQKIDPYAEYMTAEQRAQLNEDYSGTYVGIGVLMEQLADGTVRIMAVYADSTAARAGFKVGDIIVSVDGTEVQGKTLDEVKELIMGDGTELLVTVVIGRDDYTREFQMQRQEMVNPSIAYWMMDDGVAYLEILQFGSYTDMETSAGLEYLREQGMTSLVLDLRGCPGGIMDSAALTAGYLGVEGPVSYIVTKNGYVDFYTTPLGLDALGVPLAVLVDGNTASAAEMLAAAIQDVGGGSIIGETTYGKGLYQNILSLPSGAALKFTGGKYVTRGFQDVNESGGVVPDILVSGAEAQMDTALDYLKKAQWAPRQIIMTIGSRYATADAQAYSFSYAPFLYNGATYVPVQLLQKFNWELFYYNDCWYCFDGVHRIILDIKNKQVLNGKNKLELITRSNTNFIPVSVLRSCGYDVYWDGETKQVTVSR
ncbi:MAG: S41 family peptidase [Bacillota bacterium]|nr:S41 family peptidase [Bacillota bacterium]